MNCPAAQVGERAAHKNTHPGSFATAFLDGLDALMPADLASFTRYNAVE